jgi:hypothetical protein
MLHLLRLLSVLPARFFLSRRDLLLENLALRQQLSVLRRKTPHPQFVASDKGFWVILQRFWPGWKRALILVQPNTVVGGIVQASSCIGRGSRTIELVLGEDA